MFSEIKWIILKLILELSRLECQLDSCGSLYRISEVTTEIITAML